MESIDEQTCPSHSSALHCFANTACSSLSELRSELGSAAFTCLASSSCCFPCPTGDFSRPFTCSAFPSSAFPLCSRSAIFSFGQARCCGRHHLELVRHLPDFDLGQLVLFYLEEFFQELLIRASCHQHVRDLLIRGHIMDIDILAQGLLSCLDI